MTIGERIKEYRKNICMTQKDLAERLGITDQAVSKWETGLTMPDITMLVPLTTALGVSLDSLLGAETGANDEINKAWAELHEKWKDGYSDQSKDRRRCDRDLDYYQTASKLAKKYPDNMTATLDAAIWAEYVLLDYKKDLFERSEKAENELFQEIDKLTSRVWKYSESLRDKKWAKYTLISACCDMGYFGRAEAECECFGWGIENIISKRIISERTPGNEMEDFEKRLEIRRNETSYTTYEALWGHYHTLCKLGSFGAVRINEIIDEHNNFLRILEAYKGVFSEAHRLWMKLCALKMLGAKYCGKGEYDKALDVAEAIGDAAEEYFRCYKDGETKCFLDYNEFWWKSFDEEYTDEKVKEELYWRTTFWDVFSDLENNPIVTSPRYKAVVDRINNLK